MKALSAYKALAIAALALSLIFSTLACSRFAVTTSTFMSRIQFNDNSCLVSRIIIKIPFFSNIRIFTKMLVTSNGLKT